MRNLSQNHSPKRLDRKTRQSRPPRPIKKCPLNVHPPNMPNMPKLQQTQRTHRPKHRPQKGNRQPQTHPNALRKPAYTTFKTHVPNAQRRPHKMRKTFPRKTQRPQRNHPTKTQSNRRNQITRREKHLRPLRSATPTTSSRGTPPR